MRGASAMLVACVSLLTGLVPVGLASRVVAQSANWPDAIRRCWNDASANSSLGCYFTEGKLRGTMSGKDCLVEAVKAERQSNRHSALHWILACQCGLGDSEVKNAIRAHGDDAVRLVLDTYGSFVQ